MAGYNKVILIGNMTRDLELTYSSSGMGIGKGGLAINRKWKGQDGQMKEEVSFIDFTVFGKSAETIAQYVKKGNPLMLEGRLKLDQWEKDGQKRSKLGVIAENFQLLGNKPESKPQSPYPGEPDDVPM